MDGVWCGLCVCEVCGMVCMCGVCVCGGGGGLQNQMDRTMSKDKDQVLSDHDTK